MLVGIDLGTTFSAVARIDKETGLPAIIPNRDDSRVTPSVIQFTDGGVVIGVEAKEAFDAGEGDCISTFKRNMGKYETYCTVRGKSYTAEELSTMLLRKLKEDAEFVAGEKIEEAVITVPAYFFSKEREATIQSARDAGLKVRKIINEPTAAAIAYGLSHWRTNARILVYDLGGGTCDVTLIAMKNDSELVTLGTFGDHYLGGRDWDSRLADILVAKVEAETGFDFAHADADAKIMVTALAEKCKKQLTQKEAAKVSASLPAFGQCSVEVSRAEFDNATADLIEKTGVLCETVLANADIGWKDITDILLVGGSTRMPQVSAYLEKKLGKKPISHVNPDEAVALGAAVQTQLKDNDYQVMLPGAPKKAKPEKIGGVVAQEKKIAAVGLLQVKDVSTHAMGIIAVNPAGTEYINEIIIPANNPIPVKLAQSFHFYTSSREPNELDIFVLQGDRPRPLENAIPYKYAVSGIRHVKGGKTLMRIQYSYDPNGVIHVQARQEDDAADLPIRTEPVPDDMSKYGRPVEAEEMRPAETSVLLAVDVSGSMAGEPLDDAKKAMCSFVDQMDMSSTRVGIIAVSDSSEVVQRLTDNAEKCKKAIRGIICGQTGYGNFTHPFKTIREEFEKVEGRRFAIILADGVWADQPKAVSSARKCHQAEIETAAIGFGGADEQFLRDISSSDANALMTSQGELTRAFGKIAQSIGSGKKGQERDVANTKAWETEWEGANGEKSF